MIYRDNQVHFGSNDRNSYLAGCKIVSGTYTVNEFCVTGGQDPDGNIYAGATVQCGSDGIFTFRVGRHGSAEVANWFSSRIPASHNTFNQTPGLLNFAFIGELELTLTGGPLGYETRTFSFSDVALAQGHSGLSNNWWFGGKQHTYGGQSNVLAKGKEWRALGSEITVDFVRGTGSEDLVYRVGFTIKSLVNTENWMGRLEGTRRLDQIIMPGSHDAGMSVLNHCYPWIFAHPATKTQTYNIGTQLLMGCRYFDIRVDYDYNELVTCHRTDQFGCNGESLRSVLDQTREFLNNCPSETVFLKMSHIRQYGNDHTPSQTKKLIEEMLNDYSSSLYTHNSSHVNLASLPIDEVRGKIILIFEYDEYINPARGRFRYVDSGLPERHIGVYDVYSNTNNYDAMKNDQLKKWANRGGLGHGAFFLLSWTLTPQPLDHVSELAKTANSRLPVVLKDQIAAYNSKPNIVLIDFVDKLISSVIIQYNFPTITPRSA